MLERFGHGGDLLTARETFGRPEDEFLDFSSNMNPFGPPPSVAYLCARFGSKIARYPDPAVRVLRNKLAERHGIPPESILVGNGAAELIDLAIRFLRPRTAGLARPSFSEYEEALRKTNIPVVDIPLHAENNFALQQNDLDAAFTRTGLLFLGHPNNPTGRLLDPSIIREALDRGLRVILDEAFIDFSPHEKDFTFIREASRSQQLLVIRSMTKFYAIPGIRLGYLVAHPDLIDGIRRLQVPWSVNGLAQEIGVAVLDEKAYEERTLNWLPGARDRLADSLRQLGIQTAPGDANFLLLKLPASCGLTVQDVQRKLGPLGILVRDASLFPGLDRSYCRIAVRLQEENDKLVDALRLIFQMETEKGK